MEIAVRDILLSRKHCKLAPAGRGWVVIDLKSKNGTRLNDAPVGRRSLRDGDVLRLGKTTIRFKTGKLTSLTPPPANSRRAVLLKNRPADPVEAMAATVTDFDPSEGFAEPERRCRFPVPQPMPRDPDAYAREDVYSMLTEIASSSWDSIYATASRPLRELPSAPRLEALLNGLSGESPAMTPDGNVSRTVLPASAAGKVGGSAVQTAPAPQAVKGLAARSRFAGWGRSIPR